MTPFVHVLPQIYAVLLSLGLTSMCQAPPKIIIGTYNIITHHQDKAENSLLEQLVMS